MIRLPNGNVLKFSYTNRKRFTVGDPMAFPIVKINNKNPPKRPLPIARRGLPSNTAMPQPIARTTLNRSSDGWGTVAQRRRKFLFGYNGAPQMRPKSTPSRGPIAKPHYLPHSWSRPTYDAKRHPDRIRRFSTMHWTDRQTDRPTDRSFTGKFDDYRPLRSESDAA